MNVEQMRRAGMLVNSCITDDDLALAIFANALVLAYLEAHGPGWALATTPLRQERERLQQILERRTHK